MVLREQRISELAEFVGRGQSPTYSGQETSTLAINQKCVRNGKIDAALARYHVDKVRVRPTAILEPGDVCINSTGTGTIGRVGVWAEQNIDRQRTAFADSHVTVLKPKHDDVNSKYLATLLQSPPVQTALEIFCYSGSTNQIELARSALLELALYLLPRAEQDAVAEIFELIDQLIDWNENLVAKQQRIKTGMMQDLLTKGIDENGEIRSEQTHAFKDSPLGRIPASWKARTLDQLITIKHGYAFKGEYFTDESNGCILLTPGNFHVDGGLYFEKDNTKYYAGPIFPDFVLANGDLLIVMTDLTKQMAILGNACILNRTETVLHNQRIGKVEIQPEKRVLKEFLLHCINCQRFKNEVKKHATGTTVRHTAPERLVQISVPLCCEDEQKRISDVIDAVDRSITLNATHLAKLNRIKRGLMQDLLTGKVRVPVVEEDMQAIGTVA